MSKEEKHQLSSLMEVLMKPPFVDTLERKILKLVTADQELMEVKYASDLFESYSVFEAVGGVHCCQNKDISEQPIQGLCTDDSLQRNTPKTLQSERFGLFFLLVQRFEAGTPESQSIFALLDQLMASTDSDCVIKIVGPNGEVFRSVVEMAHLTHRRQKTAVAKFLKQNDYFAKIMSAEDPFKVPLVVVVPTDGIDWKAIDTTIEYIYTGVN
jgi:hypothetical protein